MLREGNIFANFKIIDLVKSSHYRVLWHSFCPPCNVTLFLGSFLTSMLLNLLMELLQIMPLVRYSTILFHITWFYPDQPKCVLNYSTQIWPAFLPPDTTLISSVGWVGWVSWSIDLPLKVHVCVLFLVKRCKNVTITTPYIIDQYPR